MRHAKLANPERKISTPRAAVSRTRRKPQRRGDLAGLHQCRAGALPSFRIDLAWRGAKAHTPQRPSPLRRMPQPRMVPLTGATIQDKIAFDTNSGPLSLRRKARCAPLTDQSGQDLDHARRADTTIDIDRQSLGELVGYRQTFELLTIGAA